MTSCLFRYSFSTLFCALAIAADVAGPDAVWQPGMQFMKDVHAACDASTRPSFGDCFVEQMQRAGAPPQAVAFTKLIHNEGYLRDFRRIGKVGVAYVLYPFRANENQAWLLVNGSPPFVDVDDSKALPQDGWRQDHSYGSVTAGLSKAALFPGDRSGMDDPSSLVFADGSQEFVVSYRVLNGCHSCASLGYAFYAFDFDPSGKLQAVKYLRFVRTPMDGGTAAYTPARPIQVAPGRMFTLVLPSNPTTGYSWRLLSAPRGSVVRLVGSEYRPPASQAIGSGGEEHWTLQPVKSGSTYLKMDYVRSGKDHKDEAAKEIVLSVIVE